MNELDIYANVSIVESAQKLPNGIYTREDGKTTRSTVKRRRQLPNGNVYCFFIPKWNVSCEIWGIKLCNIAYLNIWTPDRANPPRFVPSIDLASDSACKALILVHCEGISKATTDGNHTRMDCRTGAKRGDVALRRTFRAASWWCCCCWVSRSPAREGSLWPSRRCKQSDCDPTEGCEVPERP